jgi:CHAT domain-containing protein
MLQDDNAKKLNKIIIHPIENFINEGSRIYIVPHGMYFYIPFAAIRHGSGAKYLCETNEIVVIPSASFLPLFKGLPKVRSKQSLVIGDPDGSLRHARKEANEVAKLLDCESLIGDAASKERVLSTLKSGEFDVIHFACHWHPDTKNLEKSGFIMTDKEVITISDIADINFRANLVSIASCWSGVVDFSSSNNFVGMPKALILSGANCVVSSITPLDDESSNLMFHRFYKGYRKEGESVVRALNRSQRILMKSKSFSDPKFWASLYVTGKDIKYEE